MPEQVIWTTKMDAPDNQYQGVRMPENIFPAAVPCAAQCINLQILMFLLLSWSDALPRAMQPSPLDCSHVVFCRRQWLSM